MSVAGIVCNGSCNRMSLERPDTSRLPLDRVRIGRVSCSTKVDVQIPVGDGRICPIHDWSLIHTTDIPF
jgi:hypothetical protein